MNEATVAPAAIVTEDGTVAALELVLDRVTRAPLGPAGPFSVSVATDVAPPVTEFGDRLRDCTFGGSTVIPVHTTESP